MSIAEFLQILLGFGVSLAANEATSFLHANPKPTPKQVTSLLRAHDAEVHAPAVLIALARQRYLSFGSGGGGGGAGTRGDGGKGGDGASEDQGASGGEGGKGGGGGGGGGGGQPMLYSILELADRLRITPEEAAKAMGVSLTDPAVLYGFKGGDGGAGGGAQGGQGGGGR